MPASFFAALDISFLVNIKATINKRATSAICISVKNHLEGKGMEEMVCNQP